MNRFYAVVLGLAASTAVALTAATADANGRRSIKDGPYEQPFSWTGFYVGLQAGYAWGESSDVPWGFVPGGLVNNDGPVDLNGWVGGVHVGYNARFGNLVVGVEGDIEATSLDGDDNNKSGDTNGLDGKWMASLRARGGVLVTPKSLLYLTGGVAWLKADGVVLDEVNSSPNHTFTGWTIGVGAEHAFAPNATVRLEYRYTDFGLEVGRYANPVPGGPYDLGFEPQIHAVRLGVSLKLP